MLADRPISGCSINWKKRLCLVWGSRSKKSPAFCTTPAAIPSGHKIALRTVEANEPVRRYGQIIGMATARIEPGEHVHTHNLRFEEFDRDPEFCADVRPVEMLPPEQQEKKQPTTTVTVRSGEHRLIAVHKLAKPENFIELFILQAVVTPVK